MEKRSWKLKLGVFLMILSAIVFLSLLIVPFLKFNGKIIVTITTVMVIVGEVLFWSGGLLVGKELFNKYKSYFNPKTWFNGREVKKQ
jgi:hypothetical protein